MHDLIPVRQARHDVGVYRSVFSFRQYLQERRGDVIYALGEPPVVGGVCHRELYSEFPVCCISDNLPIFDELVAEQNGLCRIIVKAFAEKFVGSGIHKKLAALLSVPKSTVHDDIIHNATSLPTQFYCPVYKKNLTVLLAVKDDATVLPALVSSGTIHGFIIDSRDGRCFCQNQLTAHGADV